MTFRKNSRRIRKKLKQFFPKTQANLLRNSRICQPKANFFLTFSVLCENFPKILPQNSFFSLNSSKFSKNSRNSKKNSIKKSKVLPTRVGQISSVGGQDTANCKICNYPRKISEVITPSVRRMWTDVPGPWRQPGSLEGEAP